MTMPVIYTLPVVLIRRSVVGQDALGNDVYGPTENTLQGVLDPGGSTEITAGQNTVTTQPTVYLPTGSDARAVDAVRVNGQDFEVDGEPRAWPPNPFSGWVPEYSVVVKLKRVTG